jgi:ketosteroid isomerase-like protein
MKTRAIWPVLALLLPAAAARPAQNEDSNPGLAAAGKALIEAWNRHDAAALAALWHEDGDLINPAGRWAQGRAQVEKLFRDEQSTVMKPPPALPGAGKE